MSIGPEQRHESIECPCCSAQLTASRSVGEHVELQEAKNPVLICAHCALVTKFDDGRPRRATVDELLELGRDDEFRAAYAAVVVVVLRRRMVGHITALN